MSLVLFSAHLEFFFVPGIKGISGSLAGVGSGTGLGKNIPKKMLKTLV